MAESDAFMKCKQVLEVNMSKAEAFLLEKCTKGMLKRIYNLVVTLDQKRKEIVSNCSRQ